jgi:hypothetical protein
VKSGNFNVELLIISTANIWELIGLELRDILIQLLFIFIYKHYVVIARKYQNSRSK